MNALTKALALAIRGDIVAACAGVGRTHRAAISANGGSWNGSNLRLTLEVAMIGDNGQAETTMVQEFKRCASLYGLKPDDLNKTFTWAGKTYTLIGMSRRRSKYPFIGVNSSGKEYKFGREIAVLIRPNGPTGPNGPTVGAAL